MADVWPSVSAKPESALWKAAWTQSSSFQLREFFMSYSCFSISQKLCSSVEGPTILYLVKLCTFFRRCRFVIHVLLRRDLKDLGWQRIQICIWHWMAVLEEDINHGIYSPKGGLHQCCASTQKIQVPRVGSSSGYSEPSPNPRTGQEPEPWVPIFELTSNYPAPPSFTLNYPEPKPKGGSFTRN